MACRLEIVLAQAIAQEGLTPGGNGWHRGKAGVSVPGGYGDTRIDAKAVGACLRRLSVGWWEDWAASGCLGVWSSMR
jgi:hypothetical protein